MRGSGPSFGRRQYYKTGAFDDEVVCYYIRMREVAALESSVARKG